MWTLASNYQGAPVEAGCAGRGARDGKPVQIKPVSRAKGLASVLSGQGQNMIFTVFAACVTGRISLNGGRGSILGALCGLSCSASFQIS